MNQRKADAVERSRERSQGYWMKDGGAMFTRSLDGQLWRARVQADGWVSIGQAALLLAVAPMSVHRWCTDGHLKVEVGAFGVRRINLAGLRRLAIERGFFLGVGK